MTAACNCITEVNSVLGKFNTRLVLAYVGPTGAMLATEKVEPKERGKKKEMFASFCPFCGVKYPDYKSPFGARTEAQKVSA